MDEPLVFRLSGLRAAPGSYVAKGEALKASKRQPPLKTRSPFRASGTKGTRKTTGSIGRRCKTGNGFSQPVLISREA